MRSGLLPRLSGIVTRRGLHLDSYPNVWYNLPMPHYKEHCLECERRLGNQWCVVHLWLDEFFAKCGYTELHRDVRHHKKGIEEVRLKWGDQAAEAARIHIEMDFDGWVPDDEMAVQKWRHGVIQVPTGYEYKDGKLVPLPSLVVQSPNENKP